MGTPTPEPPDSSSRADATLVRPGYGASVSPSGSASAPAPERASASAENRGFPEYLTVLHELERGGVGRVSLAYDEVIGRRVAVKELLDGLALGGAADEVANSFIHEAKITGKLEHPGIVPVYALGRRGDGRPYYVMRYVKGATLEQLLDRPTGAPDAKAFGERVKLLDILINVCDTVAYAHARGVIHRDLKPGNVISGGFGETIVLDWGLAQVVDDAQDQGFYRDAITHQRHTLSDSGTVQVVGTPAYMAPEQFRGSASKASDVYSLGVILFRIITGELPYRGTAAQVQSQVEAAAASPSAASRNPTAPPELVAICDKAMHRHPAGRFADAGEFAAQLRAYRDGRMVNIYAYSRKELLRRFVAQNRTVLVMAGLILATVLGGASFSFHYAKQMQRAEARAAEALVVLTAYSEYAQQQVQEITQATRDGIARLFADLQGIARRLASADAAAAARDLEQLRTRYPRFESIAVRQAGEVSIAFSKDGANPEGPQRPIARFENERLMLLFRVPIMRDGEIVGYLEAQGQPDRILAGFLPLRSRADKHPRVVWIMRSDGLILFDEAPRYAGTNLFVDLVTHPPSLQAFGRQMLTDGDGLGYYSIIDGALEVYKIAAWDTIEFGDERGWKVVVSYAYMVKPTAAKALY